MPKDQAVIVSVAFPYAAVGSKAVGGAEVLCSQLERSMSSLGFRSVVVAHADSQTTGRLYATAVPDGSITDEVRSEVERAHQRNIELALAENEVALVHMHGFDFHRYSIPEPMQVLVTLHLPPSWYPDAIWSLPRNYHFVCVSANQRAACPARSQYRLQVVPNGVELPDAGHLRGHGRYALMLARICPEKNLHTGLEAARLAGIPVLLGGAVFPYEAHQQYFELEIAPRLTSTGDTHQTSRQAEKTSATARFLGPIAGEQKARLLSRAACLLLPSLAPETSSLVAMEALAFGVPVIGMAVGAVPEIVEHGRTGFLVQPGVDSVHQLAAAIARLPELDRKVCRAVAEERFPWTRTQDGYATLFRNLSVREAPPSCVATDSSKAYNSQRPPRQELTLVQEAVVGQITSPGALLALSAEWIELWRADEHATPFQHPSWLIPWWDQFGPDGELHALTLRRTHGGDLIGLVPLYIYQQPGAATRKLLLMGAGTTDYLDGLWRSGEDWLAKTALTYMSTGIREWDEISLDQLRVDRPLVRAGSQLGLQIGAAEATATLDLAKQLPSKIRNNIRRYRRLAARHGSLQCCVALNAEEANSSFDELAKRHSERWQGRGEPGVLQDPRVLAHHRASIPLLLGAGLLCMFRLQLEGQTIGVLYGVIDPPHVRERRLYLYLIGFAPQFKALSPGTLLLDEAVRYACEKGCTKVDLLRGGEEYKHLWGAQFEPTLALRSMSRNPRRRDEQSD